MDEFLRVFDPKNLRSVLDSITDMLAVVTRDRTIVWANRAMIEAFPGRSVIGEKCHDVFHATDLAPTSCLTCDIFTTGKTITNDVFEPSFGGGRWFNICGFPVFDEQGAVVQVIHSFRDITERKSQEESVRQNEERYRRLLESVTDAVAVFDHEWRVQIINPANLAIWKLGSDEVIGKSLKDLFPGMEDTTIPVRFRMTMEERIPVVFSEEFKFPDGRSGFFEFRLYPVPEGVMSIVTEITERLTAQRLLETSERRIRDLLENVKMIAIMLDCEGRISFANRFFFDHTGWQKDDLQERGWFDLCIPPESRGEVRKMFIESLAAGNLPSHFENSILTNSGERREIFWNNTILRNPAGEIVGTASLGEDVTEKNLARRRLEEAKEKAEATTRAKSEFLAMMSHDIRNPMNGVLGFIDLLQITSLDDEQREYVQTIKSSGEALLGLINEILDFSRIESGKIVLEKIPFNIRELVRETVRLFQAVAIGKSLRLSCEIDGALPDIVTGDPLRFRQILQNLLGNALKFTSAGEVGLSLTVEPVSGTEVRIRGTVRDTGIGIHPDRLETLFQPFVQANPNTAREFGGSGLGLVISLRLSELMGGKIEVESILGSGSAFRFEVVMGVDKSHESRPAHGEKTEEARNLAEKMPMRILIVDDEPRNCRLTVRLLGQHGYQAQFVDSGDEALRLLREQAFDVIFLDIRMSGIDGLETVRQLRAEGGDQRRRQAWVCALTAFALESERMQCLEAGMDDFLTKPLGRKDLIAALERAWSGLSGRRERSRESGS